MSFDPTCLKLFKAPLHEKIFPDCRIWLFRKILTTQHDFQRTVSFFFSLPLHIYNANRNRPAGTDNGDDKL